MGLGIFKLIWLRILFLTMTPCPQAHGSEWQEFLSSFERGPSALEAFGPQGFPEGTAFRLAINAQNAAFWMKQHIWSVLFCVKTQPGWDHDPVPHNPCPPQSRAGLWAEQSHLSSSHLHLPALAGLRHLPEHLSVVSSACDACCSFWEERQH